jgi:hypothetical protein
MTILTYTFSEEDAQHAYETWGANCGPNALAFALQLPLEAVRTHIPHFEERRYTSPSMMRAALFNLKRGYLVMPRPAQSLMFHEQPALVRIQWGGPWIINGKPARWAARQTHWIATWFNEFIPMVFDVNGGIREFNDWKEIIVPPLTASVKRCDGTWSIANIWRLIH